MLDSTADPSHLSSRYFEREKFELGGGMDLHVRPFLLLPLPFLLRLLSFRADLLVLLSSLYPLVSLSLI